MKFKNLFNRIIEGFLVVFFLISIGSIGYVISIGATSKTPIVNTTLKNSSSIILDAEGTNVTTLTLANNNSVTFEELPDVFINALISAEDARFFVHSGYDLQRIVSALANNVTTDTTQGASTLTQQLIKNMYLDSSKTVDRKIKEIVMASKLESKMSKEDILLAYANNIMFDGVTIGVNSASLKFFSKPIGCVNLTEAALLAGILNAPSYYNPIKNPLNAKKRMDTVLELMYHHNYISEAQLNDAKLVQISDMINITSYEEETYPYQSYLDIVYNEVLDLTGYNPLTTPLIIETYLDKDLQSLIDNIQKNEDDSIVFEDDDQQLAIAVIDNENGALVAAGGGRNYAGQFLFNRSVDMQNQPASTIKPLLSYALAFEYLGWNSKQVVVDEPYNYPSTQTLVNNIDYNYMGELLVEEALGYSRNTTALRTLEEVIEKVGLNRVIDYMNDINLLDVSSDKFNLSYGLGAMYHGVSPVNLASAYSMLAREGNYISPYTVKKITLQTDSKVIYTKVIEEKKVLSSESAFMVSDVLKNVVDNNYYNMGTVKINNVEMHAKTGTSSFDQSLLDELKYPSDASKDIWFAGYSADYSATVWSGFDYPLKDKEHYFKTGTDNRKYIPRKVFTKIMNYQAKKGQTIGIPPSLSEVNIVRGTNYLPDNNTPFNMITKAYYRKGSEPTLIISAPPLDEIEQLDVMALGHTMYVTFHNQTIDNIQIEPIKKVFDYSMIYGDIEYVIEVSDTRHNETYFHTSTSPSFSFNISTRGKLKIKAYTRYARAVNITSNIYQKEYWHYIYF